MAVKLGVDGFVHGKACLPVLLGADADQAITSELNSRTQPGYFRQEGKLFRLSPHTHHQVHLPFSRLDQGAAENIGRYEMMRAAAHATR